MNTQWKEVNDKLVMDGVLKKPTIKKKYQLFRSALVEYKKKFGTEYVMPEGTEIIEDLI